MAAVQGLLSTKVVHKQDRLSAVNRAHELYAAHAPAERAQPDQAAAADPAAAADAASTSGRISVTYSYRSVTPSRRLLPHGTMGAGWELCSKTPALW